MIEPDGRQSLRLFSGPANLPLAEAIAGQLEIRLGAMTVSAFRDGETRVVVHTDVRGTDVFAVQPTSAPVNEHLMELLLMLDAFHRSGASRCTAVVPYFGYARQERRTTPEEPISAKLVANLLTAAGAGQVITMDLTVGAIEGFFDLPVEHLHAAPMLAHAFADMDTGRLALVAPDLGAVKRAEAFQRLLAPNAPVAVVFKQRVAPDQVHADDMAGDVQGRDVILVDDIISTGATMLAATRLALLHGARSVSACATHGVFAPGAIEALLASPLERIVVSNTIAVEPRERLQVVSVAAVFADAIDRTLTPPNREVEDHGRLAWLVRTARRSLAVGGLPASANSYTDGDAAPGDGRPAHGSPRAHRHAFGDAHHGANGQRHAQDRAVGYHHARQDGPGNAAAHRHAGQTDGACNPDPGAAAQRRADGRAPCGLQPGGDARR